MKTRRKPIGQPKAKFRAEARSRNETKNEGRPSRLFSAPLRLCAKPFWCYRAQTSVAAPSEIG